jgi:hypothetical protein
MPAAFASPRSSVLQLVHLPAQDLVGVFDDRFAQREHVEGIVGRLAVEQRQGVDQVERERLVQGEVLLQLDVDAQAAAEG